MILTSTALLCFGVRFILQQKSDRHEWFSVSTAFLYSLGLVGLYLIILTMIGFITRVAKNTETSKSIFRTTKLSFVILFLFMLYSNYSLNKEFNKWQAQSEKASTDRLKLEQEHYQTRMDSLDIVIRSQPGNYNALVERGLLNRRNGELKASIADYQRALNINPHDFKANLEMGYTLGVLGKKQEQDSFYRIAAQIDTNSVFAKRHPEYLTQK